MMEKISIQEFRRLDLRVGNITEVTPVEGADTLYKLIVDLGESEYQAVAGLRSHYTSSELEGKQVAVIKNLESAEIHGVRSEVMILAAVTEGEEEVSVLTPDKEMPIGAEIY